MDLIERDEIIALNVNKNNEDQKPHQILCSTSTPVSFDTSKRINDSGYSTGKSVEPNTPSYHFLSRKIDSFCAYTPDSAQNHQLMRYRSVNISGPIPKFTLSSPAVAPLSFEINFNDVVTTRTLRAESEELRNRVVPRYGADVGIKQIDFIKDLEPYSPVVSRIIGYLDDKDLTNAKKVSSKWCRVLSELQNLRGTVSPIKSPEHIRKRRKSHVQNDLRLPLQYIENQLGNVRLSETEEIIKPKVHPSKINHQRFVDAAKKLLPCESLQKCPRCLSPARITPIENRGRCVGINCHYDFCSICTTNFHGDTPCPIQVPVDIEFEPSKNIRTIKSKKNLRRL